MVNLKKLVYHVREASDPFAILMSIRTITQGRHSGTKNQLIPPCPEYVKLRPGTIAKANITIGNRYTLITSRQKLGEGLPSTGTSDVVSRLPVARRQTINPAVAKTNKPQRDTNPGIRRG